MGARPLPRAGGPLGRSRRALLAALCLPFVLLPLLLLAPACRHAPAGRMSVAVSIFPIYDLVRRVAGPDADVTLLLPPGRSPAGFAPTAKDEADVGAARVVVWVGLGLDPWMGDLVQAKNAPKASVKVLKVGDRVPTLATTGKPYVDPASGGGTAVVDPHVWLDPQRATVMAKAASRNRPTTSALSCVCSGNSAERCRLTGQRPA